MLARQFLLERSSLALVPTLERIGGLQTQYAPSGYVGLWSRMRHFRRDALTAALEQRRVIQGTLLRSTIHMVSVRDYWLFLSAVRMGRQEWWRRVTRKGFGDVDVAAAVPIFREELAAGPRRATDLRELLARRGFPSIAWNGIGLWVDLIRVPPSGTWEQRKADLYGLADTWVRPAAVTESAGLEHVVRRYLGAFGPATVREIADWAGIPHATLLPAIDRLSLRQFRDEKGKVHVVLWFEGLDVAELMALEDLVRPRLRWLAPKVHVLSAEVCARYRLRSPRSPLAPGPQLLELLLPIEVPLLGIAALIIVSLIAFTWEMLTAMSILYIALLPFGIRSYRRYKAEYNRRSADVEK